MRLGWTGWHDVLLNVCILFSHIHELCGRKYASISAHTYTHIVRCVCVCVCVCDRFERGVKGDRAGQHFSTCVAAASGTSSAAARSTRPPARPDDRTYRTQSQPQTDSQLPASSIPWNPACNHFTLYIPINSPSASLHPWEAGH
jgi:hypothetical protein